MSSAKQNLEQDLMADITDQQDLFESGQDRKTSHNAFENHNNKKEKMFSIRQGIRRKHPNETLLSFAGLLNTTENPKTEQAKIMAEMNERSQLSDVYTAFTAKNDLVTQIGLAHTAMENYKKSKPVLQHMWMNGV